MARSLAAAIAAVEGPEFDTIVGYSLPPRRAAPTPEGLRRAFEGFDYAQVRAIARSLVSRYRCSPSDAEEATQDALEELLRDRPDVFARGREKWLRFLYGASRFRLFDIRAAAGTVESLERLWEAGGDAALGEAHPLMPADPGEPEDARSALPPSPGERWSRPQMIGALQRFHDHHGRPPRARECRAVQGLPSVATFRKEFGSFSAAVRSAGMLPPTSGLRRKRWTAAEAARACSSFRWRNGRWPEASDAQRNPGVLPGRSVMIRFFGGTRPAEVQRGAESILGMT
jgi:DNA-directed RNA polymerase specialized sigma24 family protein